MVLWEDLGGIVGIREAEGHPSLFAKGFAGRPFLMVGERGIGYCAALRDADPFRLPRGPLQPKMGFELRSSRAITIENKTQLIAQPPPLSE